MQENQTEKKYKYFGIMNYYYVVIKITDYIPNEDKLWSEYDDIDLRKNTIANKLADALKDTDARVVLDFEGTEVWRRSHFGEGWIFPFKDYNLFWDLKLYDLIKLYGKENIKTRITFRGFTIHEQGIMRRFIHDGMSECTDFGYGLGGKTIKPLYP